MAYTTAQLDAIIQTLEAGLASGEAQIEYQGRRLTYRSVSEIRNAIAYFTALYDNASDAPAVTTPKTRTYFLFGGKGI